MDTTSRYETYASYLSHHGIEGQKWGKKNGPPYPLGADQMNAKERRENKVSRFAIRRETPEERMTRLKYKHEAKMQKLQNKRELVEAKAQLKAAKEQERAAKHDGDGRNFAQRKIDEFKDAREQARIEKGRRMAKAALIGAGVISAAVFLTKVLDKTTDKAESVIEGDMSWKKAAAKSVFETASGGRSVSQVARDSARNYINKRGIKGSKWGVRDKQSEDSARNYVKKDNSPIKFMTKQEEAASVASAEKRQKDIEDFIVSKGLTSLLKIGKGDD